MNLIELDISEIDKIQAILDTLHVNLSKLDSYNCDIFGEPLIHPNGKKCAVQFDAWKVQEWTKTIILTIVSMGYGGSTIEFTKEMQEEWRPDDLRPIKE